MNLTNLLRESRKTIVMTGAGMSTESGLQDYRSSDGMWAGIDMFEIASEHAFYHNYEKFMDFYTWRLEQRDKFHPNEGHRILAEWENKGLVHGIITQNVDQYHQNAGSKNVVELHGNLSWVADKNTGLPRPGVVLIGEEISEEATDAVYEAVDGCELFIVMGTSLSIKPASSLPAMFRAAGANIVVINNVPTTADKIAAITIRGKIGDVLSRTDLELSYDLLT
jgi:NAD-dependent deacetylase